jgi:DNA repair protein RadC
VLASGLRAASATDLISIAASRRESDVADSQGAQILQRMRTLRGLLDASKEDLRSQTGLDDFEILRFQAAMELGRRADKAVKGPGDLIESSDDVIRSLEYLRFEKREHFVAILLDAKSAIIRIATIHVGTLTMSVVGAREVFREAINDGAASLIVAHNHPSGDPTPSPEDVDVTLRLTEVGDLLDIAVLDHIIVGENRHTSLHKLGLMRRKDR